MLFAFLLVVPCFALTGASTPPDPSTNSTVTVKKEEFVCAVCLNVGRVMRRFAKPISLIVHIPCDAMKFGKTCTGTAKLFLGALELSGEHNACTLIKFCKGIVLPLEIPQVLGNVTQGLEAVKNGLLNMTKNPIGGLSGAVGGLAGSVKGTVGAVGSSVAEATKGTGSLVSGGADVAGGLVGGIPIVGKPLGSVVAGVGGFAGGVVDKLGQGLNGALNLPFSFGQKRPKRFADVKLAKTVLDSIKVELPPSPTKEDVAFAQLAEQIRSRTLEAVSKQGLQV
ncbi:hypothetical protein ANCCAN_00473 [Ancylostoma caninum]|uniref:Saposin B-type domain-containing protein n=1 Tax=Ancylostoma caninum TaxID=29170 RepID=A0A368HCH9_ANCCA|nr:hypothetical protein ANCCAN_00473 [Ancylostoma caninum]